MLAAFCQKFQQSSTPPFFSNHHGNGRPPPSTNTADTRRAGRDIVAKQVSAPTAHSRRKEELTCPAFTRSAALGDVLNIYSLFAEAGQTGKGKGGWSQRRRRRASETDVGAHTGRRGGPIAEGTARDGGETGAGDYVALPASRATKGGAVWWGVENFRLVLTSECFCDGAGACEPARSHPAFAKNLRQARCRVCDGQRRRGSKGAFTGKQHVEEVLEVEKQKRRTWGGKGSERAAGMDGVDG